MSKTTITDDVIVAFLEGKDPQKYITAIECSYSEPVARMVINDPEHGKYIEEQKFKPFLWMKAEVADILYQGKRSKIKAEAKKQGIKFKTLTTTNEEGFEPQRLSDGYKFLVTCNGSYGQLTRFFKLGGMDVYGEKHRHLFMAISPVEQFMIQTGKRLFKGFEDYDEIHRFQFDLETEGLDPQRHAIFQIGMRDNRGFEYILEVKGDTPQERRASELDCIETFFEIIDALRPDVITGYNSENFDWDYIDVRSQRLGIKMENLAIFSLEPELGRLSRRESTVKLGSESERYTQTYMWGYNILDIMHAVRKAKAINSDIKKAGLKYITQFSRINKKNRVYVPGDMLNTIWADDSLYYHNDEDGDWFKYQTSETTKLEGQAWIKAFDKQNEKLASGKYKEVTGAYIVQRYLLDDLWETEMVDSIYNQATFLVSKILPTTFMKAATMGTASTWKLIMMAWSYENNLALPSLQPKRDFTGGLARLIEVGFAKRVGKLDYAALYPNIELTHDIFPDLDITGVMKGMLFYIVNQRDVFKFLKNDHGELADEIKEKLKDDPDNVELKAELEKHLDLKSKYDKKQLPLKILANSFFGSFGASYLFNWGDVNLAEETTCRGRQYLRLMVRHFHEKYGFRPLVGDTDGFNFAIPDTVDEIQYYCKGSHRLTEKNKDKVLIGLDAVVADFNESYMIGRMGLDIDDICNSTINFARKNYANDIGGKIKLVGNTIKSSKLPTYIEEFLGEGVRLLLDDNGKDFIELYYKKVDEIFNYQIPLAKIASKSKVNETMATYEDYCRKKTKAGRLNSRKAHMELIKKHNLKVDLGDVVYFVNIGTAASHGDVKVIKDENGNVQEVNLNCKLIPNDQLEKNPDLTTDEYNVAKYIAAFNKRITPLLVCFDDDVRKGLLIGTKKNRKTKEVELKPRKYFTEEQCKLISGKPMKDGDQDSYEQLMTMEDKEIRFWTSMDMVPNNIDLEEWEQIKVDYFKRKEQEVLSGIAHEKQVIQDILYNMSYNELSEVVQKRLLPETINLYVKPGAINDDDGNMIGVGLYSKKHKEFLVDFRDFEKLLPEAKARDEFWNSLPNRRRMTPEELNKSWEDHKNTTQFRTGHSILEVHTENVEEVTIIDEPEEVIIPDTKIEVTGLEEEEDDGWNF